MSWGISDMLGSATILMFVIPPTYAGAELLLRGNLFVGGGLLCVSLAMVVADQYVTRPSDLPALVASRVVSAIVRSPEEE